MTAGIYQIRNVINNNIYIGQTSNLNDRRWNHFSKLRNKKHHTPHLQSAFNKYGEENFVFEPIVKCETHELDRLEQELINRLNPAYNSIKIVLPGHPRGFKHSEETKRKLSNANKGRKPTLFCIERAREAHIGKPISAERKSRMKLFSVGHKINLGRILTEEHKRKIGVAQIGKIVSEEVKRRIGIKNTGKSGLRGEENGNSKLNKEDVLNIRQMFLETGDRNKIAEKYNISATLVSNIVKRKTWKHV